MLGHSWQHSQLFLMLKSMGFFNVNFPNNPMNDRKIQQTAYDLQSHGVSGSITFWVLRYTHWIKKDDPKVSVYPAVHNCRVLLGAHLVDLSNCSDQAKPVAWCHPASFGDTTCSPHHSKQDHHYHLEVSTGSTFSTWNLWPTCAFYSFVVQLKLDPRAHLLQGSEDELHPQDLFVQAGTPKLLQRAHAAVQVSIHVLRHHLVVTVDQVLLTRHAPLRLCEWWVFKFESQK